MVRVVQAVAPRVAPGRSRAVVRPLAQGVQAAAPAEAAKKLDLQGRQRLLEGVASPPRAVPAAHAMHLPSFWYAPALLQGAER